MFTQSCRHQAVSSSLELTFGRLRNLHSEISKLIKECAVSHLLFNTPRAGWGKVEKGCLLTYERGTLRVKCAARHNGK